MTSDLKDLSAYVICFNEAGLIEACLRSLKGCREIIVVDSGSTDGTIIIIENLQREDSAIHLIQRDWPGYAAQKQFALEQCQGPWCLCLDADERVSPQLREHLPYLLADANISGWKLDIVPYFNGRGYPPSLVKPDSILRLTRAGKASYDLKALVHEGLAVDGKVAEFHGAHIQHRGAPPLSVQIEKYNKYSTLKAEQLYRAGKKPRLLKLVFNPFIYFFRIFVLRRYFAAGWAGFISAVLGAIYSFLTEAKLWQLHAQKRLDRSDDPDRAYRV